MKRGICSGIRTATYVIILTAILSGCFTSAGGMDEPSNPVSYEMVVGRWENALGEALIFEDDGSVLMMVQGSTLGEGGEEIKETSGRWVLCSHDYFDPKELGDGLTEIICDEDDNGLWIDIEPINPYEFDPLIITEEDGGIELYRYHVDDAATSDEERYAKVK